MAINPDQSNHPQVRGPSASLIFCILLFAVFCLVLFTYLIMFGGATR